LEFFSQPAENLVDTAYLSRERMPENLLEIYPQATAKLMTFPNQ
jgi:hypothetical protein